LTRFTTSWMNWKSGKPRTTDGGTLKKGDICHVAIRERYATIIEIQTYQKKGKPK